ncbi:hypothetical protein ASC80_21920 [Afipia sp. Root123D2]|nr:hypothetical protein ASC80_21920 [Afipia sp. Root123D2]
MNGRQGDPVTDGDVAELVAQVAKENAPALLLGLRGGTAKNVLALHGAVGAAGRAIRDVDRALQFRQRLNIGALGRDRPRLERSFTSLPRHLTLPAGSVCGAPPQTNPR